MFIIIIIIIILFNTVKITDKIILIIVIIDLVTVFDAILTSRQMCEKLQCLYENLMSNNFHKTAVLKKKTIVNQSYKEKDCPKQFWGPTSA